MSRFKNEVLGVIAVAVAIVVGFTIPMDQSSPCGCCVSHPEGCDCGSNCKCKHRGECLDVAGEPAEPLFRQ